MWAEGAVVRVDIPSRKSCWNFMVFSLSHAALDHWYTVLREFLESLSLMSESTITVWWSANPGMVWTEVTNPGRLVAYRSRMFSSLVGSLTSCFMWWSPNMLISVSQSILRSEPGATVCDFHLMSAVLKSPPTMIGELGGKLSSIRPRSSTNSGDLSLGAR